MNDIPKFSMLQAPYASIASQTFYQAVVVHWRGLALTYLFVLLAVCTLPGYWMTRAALQDLAPRAKSIISEQLPAIRLADGRAHVSAEQPIDIRDANGTLFMHIDTTKTGDSAVDTAAYAVLTADTLLLRLPNGQQEFTLADITTVMGVVNINPQNANQMVDAFVQAYNLVGYPIILISNFTGHVIRVLVFGLLMMIFASRSLSYAAAVRVSVCASGVMLMVGTLSYALGLSIPFEWFITLIVVVAYQLFALQGIKLLSASAQKKNRQDQEFHEDQSKW